MKKATVWLDSKGIAYTFYDYKKSGISEEKLTHWLTKFDMWQLINTKGSTWRLLSDEQKSGIQDKSSAIQLILEKTSIIKRPLVELSSGEYLLGFDVVEWDAKLISR